MGRISFTPEQHAAVAHRERERIEARVRPTICQTFDPERGETVEGRISRDDFDALIALLNGATARERERCAALHESVNPASDRERHAGDPGAGAMAAVLEYRDLIRGVRT